MKLFNVMISVRIEDAADNKEFFTTDVGWYSLPQAAMVAVQRLLVGVLNTATSWGDMPLSQDERAAVEKMTK